jgi:hypothetical protein
MMGNGLLTRTKEEHSNKDRLRHLALNVFSVNPDSGHITKVFSFHEFKKHVCGKSQITGRSVNSDFIFK